MTKYKILLNKNHLILNKIENEETETLALYKTPLDYDTFHKYIDDLVYSLKDDLNKGWNESDIHYFEDFIKEKLEE